jgi:hypothetical protein
MRLTSAGNLGIGSSSLASTSLRVSSAITGATSAQAVRADATIQSDVTAGAVYYLSSASTAAASFTVSALSHFYAIENSIGAGSSVTNQYAFRADAGLVGATNNYSFFAANNAAVTSGNTAYSYYTSNNIATGGGTTWAFYSAGTAPSYFAGAVILDTNLWVDAPAPTVATGVATLTAAQIKTGIVSTTGTTYTLTLPTGTDIDSSFTGIPLNTNIGFDVSFVNTASGTITIGVNTGVTSLGSLTIATGTSAMFRLRRTAANTYVVYRIA